MHFSKLVDSTLRRVKFSVCGFYLNFKIGGGGERSSGGRERNTIFDHHYHTLYVAIF